jgi:hypothetical protein
MIFSVDTTINLQPIDESPASHVPESTTQDLKAFLKELIKSAANSLVVHGGQVDDNVIDDNVIKGYRAT